MVTCTNCHLEIPESYCGKCGEPAQLKRIDWHYIQHEIEHVLHFDKGIFYTIKELLVRPERSVKAFINHNRSRLVKPVVFIIITSLVYTIVNHLFHLEDHYLTFSGEKKSSITAIFSWIQSHYGYANIMMGIFISLWLKLFFRKYDYNFFEILILLCFIVGINMLIFSFFAIIEAGLKVQMMQVAVIVALVYTSWSVGQFFDKKKIFNYFKAFAAYLLGMLTFSLSIVVIGVVIDLIFRH